MDFTKKDKLRLLEKALRLCLFCHGYLSDIESVEMKSTLIWSPLFPHKIFSQEISDRQVPPSLSLSIWIYLPPPPLCLTHSLLTLLEAPWSSHTLFTPWLPRHSSFTLFFSFGSFFVLFLPLLLLPCPPTRDWAGQPFAVLLPQLTHTDIPGPVSKGRPTVSFQPPAASWPNYIPTVKEK